MSNYHATGLRDLLAKTAYKAQREHYEMVERIVRTKLIEAYGSMPTDEELAQHGNIIQTTDNWHHLTYNGETLISWSGDLRYVENESKLVRDYKY